MNDIFLSGSGYSRFSQCYVVLADVHKVTEPQAMPVLWDIVKHVHVLWSSIGVPTRPVQGICPHSRGGGSPSTSLKKL